MSTLTIIPYAPKPPNNSSRKPLSQLIARHTSSSNRSLQINMPVEVMQELGGGAATNYHWDEKVVEINQTKVYNIQMFKDDLVKSETSIAEKDAFDDNTNNDFATLMSTPPPNSNYLSAENPSLEISAKKGSDLGLGNYSFDSCGWKALSKYDSLVRSSCHNISNDNYSTLDTERARHILDNKQLRNDIFTLKCPPVLSKSAASEHDNGANGTGNKSPQTAKRQRPVSPPSNSTLSRDTTPLLLNNQNKKGSQDNFDCSDSGELGYDNDWPIQQGVSALLGDKKDQKRRNKCSRCSSSTSEEDKDNNDNNNKTFASSTRTTPISEFALPMEVQLCSQVINAD